MKKSVKLIISSLLSISFLCLSAASFAENAKQTSNSNDNTSQQCQDQKNCNKSNPKPKMVVDSYNPFSGS